MLSLLSRFYLWIKSTHCENSSMIAGEAVPPLEFEEKRCSDEVAHEKTTTESNISCI